MATTDYNRTTGTNIPVANRKNVLAWVIGGVILALVILMLALPNRQERVIDNPQDNATPGTAVQPLNENTAPGESSVPDAIPPATEPGTGIVPDSTAPTRGTEDGTRLDDGGTYPQPSQPSGEQGTESGTVPESTAPSTGGTEDGTRLDEGGTYPQPNRPAEGTQPGTR